jgi:arabinofuranosyltransferase
VTEQGPALFLRRPTRAGTQAVPLRPDLGRSVFQASSIGIYGYILGTDIHVVDLQGLADPIAGRLTLERRGRPGHEKLLPEAWVIARFARGDVMLPTGDFTADDIATARRALACGDARRLLDATTAPLTPGRFARNLVESFRLHSFRLPGDPAKAVRALC